MMRRILIGIASVTVVGVLLILAITSGAINTKSGLIAKVHPTVEIKPVKMPPAVCPPNSGTQVTINVGTHGEPLYPELSSTVDNANHLMPSRYDGAQPVLAHLAQWQPKLVRLHFGFHGTTSLPESRPGQWDFTAPDTAISNMRAQHTTFILNVRSAPPFMFNSSGKLRDGTFHEYARYLARLVGWYNKGGFTDDAGVYHHSGHQGWIHTWEIWNEPSSSSELPVAVPHKYAPFLGPIGFAQLYNTAVAAMRAVDPSIIVGGPAINGHDPSYWANYIGPFVAHLTQPLAFISFHMYPTGSVRDPDLNVLNTLNSRLPAAIDRLKRIAGTANHGHGAPLWLDEAGWSESSQLPVDPRDNSRITNAFIVNSFAIAVTHKLSLYTQFPLISINPGGLIDLNTATAHTSFYLLQLISHTMPAGSTLLPLHYTSGSLKIVATISTDQKTMHVLLGNTAVAHAGDVNGYGVGQRVCIILKNAHQGVWPVPQQSASTWVFGPKTPANSMPAATAQPVIVQPNQAIIATYLPGYSATEIEIPLA